MTVPPSANARKISSLRYDKLRELKGANPPTQKDLACFLKRKFSEFINLTICVIFQFIGVHFIVYLLHEKFTRRNRPKKTIMKTAVNLSSGALSNDDDDGSENFAEKRICVLSNLIASVWTRPICQMQATFPGVEFLRIFFKSKRRRKIRRRMSTSSTKRQIKRFHIVIVQWTSKNCSVMHGQSCCFDH